MAMPRDNGVRPPIRFSRGKDKHDNTPTQLSALDFNAFQKMILADRSQAKGVVYFAGPLSFGPHDKPDKYPNDAHYRLASHALARRFLAIDYDGFRDQATFADIFRDFGTRFKGFGYTTWSHREDAPRARAVFELDREVTRSEGIALGRAFDRMISARFGDDAATSDPCVHRTEQPVYAPGIGAIVYSFEGPPIDVDGLTRDFADSPTNDSPQIAHETGIAERAGYARLTEESLVRVLSQIDCNDEPTWFSVANALARSYGEAGRAYFVSFSEGIYSGTPYREFDPLEVNEKYDRALEELVGRPDGYGIRHLMQLSGFSFESVTFEAQGPGSPEPGQKEIVSPHFPLTTPQGKPKQVTDNLKAVLLANGVSVRYNQIKKRCEILVPGLACVADETSNTTLNSVIDLAVTVGMTPTRVPEMLDAIASENPFCPVQTYIESKPWDGNSRFDRFVGQMQVNEPEFVAFLMRKWLIQAVAAVYEKNGIANAGVICLSGAQGIGKTMLFKDLTAGVPDMFLEGQTLNPADKDSVMSAVSHWIVELGELDATFRKADLAQLKAFVTKTKDTLRRPYAKKDSEFPRRTVFAGTVNDLEFLHDTTGNRRFWPIEVLAINRDTSIDVQQLWAEAKTWYEAGEKWYLSPSELKQLEEYSDTFTTTEPVEELLLSIYKWEGCTKWKAVCARVICSTIGLENPSRVQLQRLAAVILKYNGGQRSIKSNGLRKHFVPENDGSISYRNAID